MDNIAWSFLFEFGAEMCQAGVCVNNKCKGYIYSCFKKYKKMYVRVYNARGWCVYTHEYTYFFMYMGSRYRKPSLLELGLETSVYTHILCVHMYMYT